MRRGEIRGQGGGRRDGTRGIHWAGVRLFLTPGFEPCQSLIEAGLDVDDAELAVFDFAMRSHGPEETDAMAGKDRKSTRLNSSHANLVCRLLLEKKKKNR